MLLLRKRLAALVAACLEAFGAAADDMMPQASHPALGKVRELLTSAEHGLLTEVRPCPSSPTLTPADPRPSRRPQPDPSLQPRPCPSPGGQPLRRARPCRLLCVRQRSSAGLLHAVGLLARLGLLGHSGRDADRGQGEAPLDLRAHVWLRARLQGRLEPWLDEACPPAAGAAQRRQHHAGRPPRG